MFLKISKESVINISACGSIYFKGSYDNFSHISEISIEIDGHPVFILRDNAIIYFLENNDFSVLPRQVREIIEQAIVDSELEELEVEKRG